jgi:enoyl-CoA hydratase/carnithine racemase
MAPKGIVVTRLEGPVRVITLLRAAKRFAVDRQPADALDAAPNELDGDAAPQIGALTGGSRVFCASGDPSDRFGATSSWQRVCRRWVATARSRRSRNPSFKRRPSARSGH